MAAQVQLDTTADATSPDLTLRPAVENSSDVCTWSVVQLGTCSLWVSEPWCKPRHDIS